jgi:hypothetical protein
MATSRPPSRLWVKGWSQPPLFVPHARGEGASKRREPSEHPEANEAPPPSSTVQPSSAPRGAIAAIVLLALLALGAWLLHR